MLLAVRPTRSIRIRHWPAVSSKGGEASIRVSDIANLLTSKRVTMFIKFLILVEWKASLPRKALGRGISIRTPHFKMPLTQHPPTALQREYIGQSGA